MKVFIFSLLAVGLCSLTSLAFAQTSAQLATPTYNPTASSVNNNTAGGTGAVPANKGGNNTAFGRNALSVTTGNGNVGMGVGALQALTTGKWNTAIGTSAGRIMTTPAENTVVGFHAGYYTTGGSGNTFVGSQSGFANATGVNNTYLGFSAGSGSRGDRNVFLGAGAGNSNLSGSGNIYINYVGSEQAESNTMRLGQIDGISATYIAGIWGTSVLGALPVVVNAAGQLGVAMPALNVQAEGATVDPQTAALITTLMQRVDQLEARVTELEAAKSNHPFSAP